MYTEKSQNGCENNQEKQVVKELAVPYKGSGRNITMNNFFALAQSWLSRNLAIVCTLQKNKNIFQ